MKKWIFVLLSLSFSGLAAYTERIIVLAKEDKRFILIGTVHLPHEFSAINRKQNQFFNLLNEKLNTVAPEKTMFYHEFNKDGTLGNTCRQYIPDPSIPELEDLSLSEFFKLTTKELFLGYHNRERIYRYFKKMDGEALAKIRFHDPHRKFFVKDIDTREPNSERTLEKSDALIESLLKKVKDRKKYEEFLGTLLLEDPPHIPIGPNRDPSGVSLFANDLQFLLEEFLDNDEKKYTFFFLTAGDTHIEKTTSKMLQLEGWKKILEIESVYPADWEALFSLEDPLLQKIFSEDFKSNLKKPPTKEPEMPEDPWEIIGSDDEDPDASGFDLVIDPSEGASGPAPK